MALLCRGLWVRAAVFSPVRGSFQKIAAINMQDHVRSSRDGPNGLREPIKPQDKHQNPVFLIICASLGLEYLSLLIHHYFS